MRLQVSGNAAQERECGGQSACLWVTQCRRSKRANTDILTSGVRIRRRGKQQLKLTTTPAAAGGNHRGKPPS